MTLFKKYIPALGALLAATAFVACQDDFDNRQPAFEAPVAEHQANMSILDLKKLYWNDATNYIDTIGYLPGTEEEHIYISGRVCSSDKDGNIFKSLIIQDNTAALAISINQYDLYLQYRPGQEIVIDATNMYIGKYNGLVQLGLPEWYESGQVWEASFMPVEFFRMHADLNGFPEPALVDTLVVNNFADLPTDPENLCKWQSQLVRFNNVYFQDANGTTVFSEYKSSGVNRNIVDIDGNTLPVRTSGYSTFWNNPLPTGNGDVVCILSFYGSTGWQLMLNDLAGCMNFGNPTIAPGLEGNPYPVADAIALIQEGKEKSGWVSGYIVGAVAPEVTEVTSNDDIEWCADPVLNNTLVIGATPDTKDIAQSLIISLPMGSDLRKYGNLVSHPENYQKAIRVKGTFGMYMGSYGVLDNPGAADWFAIDGVEIENGGGSITDGNGTLASPYSAKQALDLIKSGSYPSDKVYIAGIVSQIDNIDTSYGNATYYLSNDGKTANQLEVYRGYGLAGAKFTKGDEIKVGDNLVIYGQLTMYNSTPEVTTGSSIISINGSSSTTPDTPGTGQEGSGTGSKEDPFNVAAVKSGASGTAWVKGYIVGWVDGMTLSDGAKFNNNATSKTNLLLADSPDATTVDACIPVQLPSGAVRNALNLQDNPGNYKKEVSLYGSIETYFSTAGLKAVTEYAFDQNGGSDPGTDPTPSGDEKGSGTQADPYNVARALAIINAGSYTDSEVYVAGKISEIKEVSTSYGNATYFISDDGTTAVQLEVFRGYYLNGDKFTSEDQIKVGDEVLVLGKLTLYGTTPEITQGNKLITINGNSTPDTPDDPVVPDEPTGDGDGTETSPYTVSQVIAGASGKAWVDCYIVGWVNGNAYATGATFNADATVATNLVVADSPDCTDPDKCVPVQLPSGAVRTALNLQANPGNLKKHVVLYGSLEKYFLVPGIKSVSSYKFVE